MEPEMFREFGVPSFGVLDTWWVKTPKMHTLPAYAFHQYHWFALKLFSCRLCTEYHKNRCFSSGSVTLETVALSRTDLY